MKNKLTTIIILIITFVLAGVAIFTAVRLYQLRSESVSPAAPESKPAAAGAACGGIAGTVCPSGEVCIYADGTTRPSSIDASGTCQAAAQKTSAESCSLAFTLTTSTATATATATSTSTSTATATGTSTATATATSTSTSTATETPTGGTSTPSSGTSTPGPSQPSLPQSGTSWPTILGAGIGILVILGSLLLAL